MRNARLLALIPLVMIGAVRADTETVTLHAVSASGVEAAIGTVTLMDSRYGLVLKPKLSGLEPGLHGFHVHQNPSCDAAEKDGNTVPGLAAGGHYDPANSGFHAGPYGDGHLGDLPPLHVDADGSAALPVLAPRLAVADVRGRALMIHAGGDNYSDQPSKLGGGGARVACGVIE